MALATDDQILARYRDAEAPLLPLLHAFHERDHCLTSSALRAVATALRIPLADLWGTVSFYHHFAREGETRSAPRICTGPICSLRGAHERVAAMAGEGATAMPCSGRCDQPIPALVGDRSMTFAGSRLVPAPRSPLPAPNPGGLEECVFAGIRAPDRGTMAGYLASGGGRGLERARGLEPAALLDELEAAGLAGRGGAGFPTARKWRAVREAAGEAKVVVCNADEGEPGCFKDRALMDHDPLALIEGMAIAALATGATLGFIYLRYEYPETLDVLDRALTEARAAGMIGGAFEIHLRRGAGAYICGEETSLLNSLEGKHPFPRNRPPFPVTHGYRDRPTAVNNVETLCSVAPILARGAAWYRGLGLGGQAGTKVISLSGDVLRPGNYEVPLGFPLARLIHDWAGGLPAGRTLQAVTMAGLSGGFLGAEDVAEVTLDEPSIRARGSFLGAGGIMVFDSSRDMVAVAREAMAFFAHESCGKCFPCRIGSQRLTERLGFESGPTDQVEWRREIDEIARTMKATSACGLGIAAPLVAESLIRLFPGAVTEKFQEREAR
ncbi:MAG: NAD(P)H-dependent oxidoreductase subunit E [Planctomycetes bacterium]|nr:NAD(P)H-dependent oxidoreductase subunit E [Planctomycetota bacterium]